MNGQKTSEGEDRMSKKLKELAGEKDEGSLAGTVRESAHNIWLAGLGAFAKAQEEGGKLFETLVKEGEIVQQRARKSADEKIAEVNATASGTWEKLEQVFEDRVARALRGLGVPTGQDVKELSARVSELTAVVEKLNNKIEDKSGSKRSPAKA
jgi:poly(hydroxyalkanoate) granule-associated protein